MSRTFGPMHSEESSMLIHSRQQRESSMTIWLLTALAHASPCGDVGIHQILWWGPTDLIETTV